MYIIVSITGSPAHMTSCISVSCTGEGALSRADTGHYTPHVAIYEAHENGLFAWTDHEALLYHDTLGVNPLFAANIPPMIDHVDTPPLAGWPQAEIENCDGMEEPPAMDRTPEWGDIDELEPPAWLKPPVQITADLGLGPLFPQ